MAASSSSITFSPLLRNLSPLPKKNSTPLYHTHHPQQHQLYRRNSSRGLSIKVKTLDFSGTFFEGGFGDEDDFSGSHMTAIEEKEELQCPPGLRQYETMMILRPDISEDERLTLTQKYEEVIVAGGGMYVEVFNRGVLPLSFRIKKINRAGESNFYLDGLFLVYTYFTKPESVDALDIWKMDDNVLRLTSFKIKKRRFRSHKFKVSV